LQVATNPSQTSQRSFVDKNKQGQGQFPSTPTLGQHFGSKQSQKDVKDEDMEVKDDSPAEKVCPPGGPEPEKNSSQTSHDGKSESLVSTPQISSAVKSSSSTSLTPIVGASSATLSATPIVKSSAAFSATSPAIVLTTCSGTVLTTSLVTSSAFPAKSSATSSAKSAAKPSASSLATSSAVLSNKISATLSAKSLATSSATSLTKLSTTSSATISSTSTVTTNIPANTTLIDVSDDDDDVIYISDQD
ncbi:hypothetical protein EGW08_014479, partial [Elysia chlorotica]